MILYAWYGISDPNSMRQTDNFELLYAMMVMTKFEQQDRPLFPQPGVTKFLALKLNITKSFRNFFVKVDTVCY
jgi:hypothetical protein